ncbi:MAG: Ig-like domain-containing protein [Gemmatimonadetes bacterium]|nr:Ig-like domain-containing protein [Gemmatimonadota bacterium]
MRPTIAKLEAGCTRQKLTSSLAAMVAFVTLLSCGGEDQPTTPPEPEPSRPTEVSIEPDTVVVTAGDTVHVRAVVLDQRGRLMFNASLTWTTSDPAVATIDATGVVTGIREGKTGVSVTAGAVSASAPATVHSKDRRTLMNLLYSAGGEGWTDNEHWGTDEPVGSWYGVEANGDARVTALRLSDNGLSGHLPEDLGEMVFLTELEMDGNEELSGPIPFSLSDLNLQQLQYGNTMLCTVRDEGFRAWLNAIPTRDGDFLACNEERSDLMKLYDAMGGDEWLNSANWGTAAALDNWFGIEVDSAGRVTEIDLDRNELSGEIPAEIQYFPHLRLLRLDYNDLEGEIPPEIGKLTELRRMDIDGNNFTGRIPPEFGNLVNLRVLWMGGNDMSGPIPPEFGNLKSLRELYLYEADFDGSIPAEFGGLTELRHLDIHDTRIDGPIPATLGALEKLAEIEVYGNRISGPLPAELGQLDSLEVMNLRDNRISGPLPPEFGQLDNLAILILRDNMIDGALPGELGQLDNLLWISAEDNMLSGPLPPGFGELDSLVLLHLQNNPGLSGPLPGELTSLLDLRELIAYETGLCAPSDPEIRTWLNDVVTKWRVPSCGAEAHAVAHLIQSTQSSEYPVPLVAGRSALLRVFVMSEKETTETIPPVRATFFVGGSEVHAVDIPAGTFAIPTEVQMGELGLSANAEIPAEVIQPGLEMVVEVDPNATVDQALGVAKRVPAEGRMAVEVREVPPMHLTLVPFISPDDNRQAVAFVGDATADHDLFFETRTLLPVGVFEIRKHSSVRIDSNSIFAMLAEVERIRAIEQGTGHWMALNATAAGAAGVAYFGANPRPGRGKISASRLSVGTIAHELGHNLNLRHTDCGNPAGVDPTFPYPGARTGVWGYDPRDGGSLVPSSWADFMSYCDPAWVSDYYFTNALRFRLADTTEVQASAATRTLLVSGGASADGALHLDPTFLVETSPVVPHFPGPYQMTGRRADGSELFSLSFEMQEVMDGDGRSGFMFALPVEAGWELDLASLVLTGPDGSVEMREGSEPPMAIMRDPVTGQVRAIMRDLPAGAMVPGALDGLAPEPGLEIMVSGGLPGVVAWRR